MRFYSFVFLPERMRTACDRSGANGNSASSSGTRRTDNARGQLETGRFLFWTEDNRMHAAADDRYYSYYAYDHSGGSCASREQSQACLSYAEMKQRGRSQRRLKLTGDNNLLDVNADFMATYTLLNEPTLYPSAYMVLTNKGYTNVAKAESRASSLALPRRSSVTGRKHYYAGTERVAARLGGGGLDALGHAIGNNDTLLEKADLLFNQSLDQVNNRVLQENDPDCIMNSTFAREEFGHWIEDIPLRMQAIGAVNLSPFWDMANSMLGDHNNGRERDVYFYHSDHLGSASWITDFSGMAVQHLQYLPYGEPYINQRISNYNERFTFTGKERDEETGYGYFGARYYDADLLTGWLSSDPMADKYTSLSPYNYCAWNPVKLVDPDGREVYISGDAAGNAVGQLSSKGITGTRDDATGRLSYTETGKRLSKSDRLLMAAINSTDVRVNVYATNKSNVEVDGLSLNNSSRMGQFLGVSLSDCIGNPRKEIRNAETCQLVNPSICQSRDNTFNVELGTSMRHEITESYQAGRICINEGISCGPNWASWNGIEFPQVKGDVYSRAHEQATPQADVRRKQIDESQAAFKAEMQKHYGFLGTSLLSF